MGIQAPAIAKRAKRPPPAKAAHRVARHLERARDPAFRVAIDHGVRCGDELVAEVLRSTAEDIDRDDDPDSVARRRRAGDPRPIYAGRRHSRIRIYNTEGVPRRDVLALGRYRDDGSFTVYRYGTGRTVWRPVTDADNVLPPYDMAMFPWIQALVAIVHERTGEAPNHCIVTRYTDSGDSISAHRDKTLDIMPGTHIHAFSFGAARTFRCVHMDLPPSSWREDHETQSGGLLSIAYDHNLEYKHQVMPRGAGARVSIVLRTCRTRFDAASMASERLAAPDPICAEPRVVRTAREVNVAKVRGL